MGDTEETVAHLNVQVNENEVVNGEMTSRMSSSSPRMQRKWEMRKPRKGSPWFQDQMFGNTSARSNLIMGRIEPSASTVASNSAVTQS
jgi:hypothetical protein